MLLGKMITQNWIAGFILLYCVISHNWINYLKSGAKPLWSNMMSHLHDFCFAFDTMGGIYNQQTSGLKLLVEKYRKIFRVAENLNHYSEENYKIAERKFLKFALSIGDAKDHTDY